MLDLKWIRENPEKFDLAIKSRSAPFKAIEILEIDEEKRKKTFLIQELQAKRNKLAQQMAEEKRKAGFTIEGGWVSEEIENLIKQGQEINKQLAAAENDFSIDEKLNQLLAIIPNVPDVLVPIGKSEEENVEIEKFGTPKIFDFAPKSHDELGEKLGMLDFEQSSLMSGARFSTLSSNLARLERALSNFMLDVALENGYNEISPPNLVKSNAMFNSGQLPKFAEDAFKTTDDYWLIPTSEVSLINLVSKKNLNENDLPLRFTAYTPCFRREAGSAGKDTKGLIRQHQFKKVELVSITTPENSDSEHERMTNIACEILHRLELPFRKILLCTGDMGFGAKKTYDLEVWLPSQAKYREISSCSNCGDFQARRASIKFKRDGKNYFAHTLNGSALAVGRTLVAILENYQNQDGSINVPEVLFGYMANLKKIC